MMYIWKEWKEQTRGKGVWLAIFLLFVAALTAFYQTKNLPAQQSFAMLLLSLYETAVYMIPLFCLFLASFSVMAEKESKALLILLVKEESTASFLLKKSGAVQAAICSAILAFYMLFVLICKWSFLFSAEQFLAFLLALLVLMLIFNQLGILIGYYSTSKLQAIGWNLFCWFVLLFLFDMVYLNFLPYVTYENVKLFSILYFFNPFHAVRFYLETALGIFSLANTSRLLSQFLFLSPVSLLAATVLIWLPSACIGACFIRNRRITHD